MVQQSKELGPAKRGGESGSAMNQDSCCRQEMAVHVSTDAGMRGSQGTAISYARKIQLVHLPGNLSAASYIDEVLTPQMPHVKNLRREVFQHDNARPHTARATVDFLANQNVTVLLLAFK